MLDLLFIRKPSSSGLIYLHTSFNKSTQSARLMNMTSQGKAVPKINPFHNSDPIRTRSNPTLEQVIAQQNHQASQHPPAILPRPAHEPSIQVIPAAPKSSTRRQKRSRDDPRPRPNRCPLPGTEEAKYRTLMASMARCKSDNKKRELLQRRGITEEEFRHMLSKPKKRSRSTENKGNIEQISAHSPPQWGHEKYGLPCLREVLGYQEGSRESWMDDPMLYEEGMRINQYYSGHERPHLLCVIAKFQNFDQDEDSALYDYQLLSAIRHTCLNGNQALRLAAEVLSAIQQNPGSIRCELAKLERCWECILLDSILLSCCATVSLQEPEILAGGRLCLNAQSFDQPTFIIDITDPSDPKYCYLVCRNGFIRTLAHPPRDLGWECHHTPVLINHETYAHTHALAEYQLIKIHAVLSTWPFLAPERIPPFPALRDVDLSSLGIVKAYWNPWPIIYPPELTDLQRSRKSEEIQIRLTEHIRYPRNGYYMDLIYIYIPFAPFMSNQLLLYLMEFYYKLQGLTLAGSNIFNSVGTCQVLQTARRGLVYLNLLSCPITEEGLGVIRNIKTLDTFIHESTILPGLQGTYRPSMVEGNRKSLKVCLTYVDDNPQHSDEMISEMMEEYTISGDESLLTSGNLIFGFSGIQHPFMGPVSAVNCLKTLVTRLHEPDFIPASLNYFAFFKGIFCKGYHPEARIGLPVYLPKEKWEDDEDDLGTRLMVTYCRGKIYACFLQMSDQPKVIERFTAHDYLVRYKDQFVRDMVGDVIDICESLGEWCGNGLRIPRHEDISRSPKSEQVYQEKMFRNTQGIPGLSPEEQEYLRIPPISIDSSSDEDTEIEDI